MACLSPDDMGFLADYIKEILGFVVISGLVVNILPDNKNLKYVKLFTGLVMTLLLISPLLKLGKVDIDSILAPETAAAVSADELGVDIQDKLDKEYERILKEYIAGLTASYGRGVRQVKFHNDEVYVYLGDNENGTDGIERINIGRIVLTEDMESSNYRELKEIIAAKLKLTPEKVHIYETG